MSHHHLYQSEEDKFVFLEAIDYPSWLKENSHLYIQGTAGRIIFFTDRTTDISYMVNRKSGLVDSDCPICCEENEPAEFPDGEFGKAFSRYD